MSPLDRPSSRAESAPADSDFPTVGILGGGQLGRMLAMAAVRLGIQVRFYDPDDSGPAAGLGERFVGSWNDKEQLRRFAQGCDVITFENEWARVSTLEEVRDQTTALLPSRRTLNWITDKVVQKLHAQSQGLPVGDFRECRSLAELQEAGRGLGFPLVLKRPRHSYDGYGNAAADHRDELEYAYERLGGKGSVLVEAWVPFVRELSVIVVRRADGEMVTYPVAYTRQRDHRCESVEVPAPISAAVERRARSIARAAAEAFDIVGVAAIELFELESGELLFNEIAPRPHNSGHFTIEGCATSQFENHLRAILGWPLGDTSLVSPASVMVNILGQREGEANGRRLAPALQVPRTSVHIYGKKSVRPNRKMGHVTALGEDMDEVRQRAFEAAKRVRL